MFIDLSVILGIVSGAGLSIFKKDMKMESRKIVDICPKLSRFGMTFWYGFGK